MASPSPFPARSFSGFSMTCSVLPTAQTRKADCQATLLSSTPRKSPKSKFSSAKAPPDLRLNLRLAPEFYVSFGLLFNQDSLRLRTQLLHFLLVERAKRSRTMVP